MHDAVDASYSRDFAYDDLNRLATANSGSSLWGAGSYTYDGMGNMLTATLGSLRTDTFAYQGSTPKLATAIEAGTPRAVVYDAAGNEAQVGADAYGYSPRNELTSADGVIRTYDARGIRTVTSYPAGPGIVSLQVNPSSVNAGDTSTGVVTLTDAAAAPGVTIALSSDNDLVARVPRAITVATGATSATFTVSTTAQTGVPNVAIHAAYQGSTATALLTLNPYVASLTIDHAAIDAGSTATGTVTLGAIAPAGGVTVPLTSSNATAASVPATIIIPSGSATGTFSIPSYRVDADTVVTITATKMTSASATLTVRMNPATLSSTVVLWKARKTLRVSRPSHSTRYPQHQPDPNSDGGQELGENVSSHPTGRTNFFERRSSSSERVGDRCARDISPASMRIAPLARRARRRTMRSSIPGHSLP